MNQQMNSGTRILAREVAEELTVEELAQVSGGQCTTTGKATWSQEKGSDAEITVTCTM